MPAKTLATATRMEMPNMARKSRLTCWAVAAGRIISAETRMAPTILRATAMVKPTSVKNKYSDIMTSLSSTMATSRLKVSLTRVLPQYFMVPTVARRRKTERMMSVRDTTRISPNSNEVRSTRYCGSRLMMNTARAMELENSTPMMVSEASSRRCVRPAITKAIPMLNSTAPSTGDTFSASPTATPARLAWAMASLKNDMRRSTTNTPISAAATARTSPAINDRWIKA